MGALNEAPIPAPAPAATRLLIWSWPKPVYRANAADQGDRALPASRAAESERRGGGDDLRRDDPGGEIAAVQGDPNHGLGDAAGGNAGPESSIQTPRDEQPDRDRDQEEPSSPSKSVVGRDPDPEGAADGPHENGGPEADENAEGEGRGQELRSSARDELLSHPSSEADHWRNGNES